MFNDPPECLTKDQPPFKLKKLGGFSEQINLSTMYIILEMH